jgi:hypothetical protein
LDIALVVKEEEKEVVDVKKKLVQHFFCTQEFGK